jgi:hypothetical protein
MKLIKFNHQEDYGHNWYVRVLFTKQRSLFQGCVSWSEYPGSPYLQIKFGMGSLITILLQVHKFGLDIGLFESIRISIN